MGVIATCDWCGEVVETSEIVRLDLKGAGRSSDWYNGTGWVSIYHSKGPDSCVRHVLDLLDMMHTSRADFRTVPVVANDLPCPATEMRATTRDRASQIMRNACAEVAGLPGWTPDEEAAWRLRAQRGPHQPEFPGPARER